MLTFAEHLAELRWRCILCVLVYAVAFLTAFAAAGKVLFALADYMACLGYSMITLTPAAPFEGRCRLSAGMAFVPALPVVLYHIKMFVRPGKRLKTAALGIVLMLLFTTGIGAGAVLILRLIYSGLGDLYSAGTAKTVSIEAVTTHLVAAGTGGGIMMLMPAAVLAASAEGLISRRAMAGLRPFAYVGIFVLGALLTPPDVISMLAAAGVMVLIYEISVGVCLVAEQSWRRKRKNATYEN